MSVRACIIVIGQEILAGVTTDTNSGYIAKVLREIGVDTVKVHTIPDEVSEIQYYLKHASRYADIIITTGGLGPTKDDKTKSAFAEFFKRDWVEDQAVLSHLKAYLESKNKGELYQNNLEQGKIPEGAEVLLNTMGTAPALCFHEEGRLYFMLPGVPYEMKKLLKEKVLPKISKTFVLPYLKTRTLFVSGIPESMLSLKLEDWELSLPKGFSLSYLPENSIVKLRLSYSGEDETSVNTALEKEISQVKNLIAGHFFDIEKESKEAIVHYHLKRLGYVLSTAESFTAGMLMNRLLSLGGSSEVVAGGICTYQTSQKITQLHLSEEMISKEGVVSEAVALEMMQSAKKIFGTEVCISTTGCAGPATDEFGTPVGTAYYAIGIGDLVISKKLSFPGLEREDFVKFCTNRILQELILQLEKL